ncbi:2-oxo-4-hydroxy-4-carboxy-5-ureidoimidazoline decarboxylase [Paraglaciecola aestuariivivens]
MNQNITLSLEQLNALPALQAQEWFSKCCAAPSWYKAMSQARPFTDLANLKTNAQTLWDSCSEADYKIAFEAHPMIGDVNSLRAKYAKTKAMASNEQQGASEANEATLQALAEANHQYLNKHGFIFIICATGLSAQTMLDALLIRLNNDTQTEISLAAQEQIKITLLRLEKGIQAL